MLPADHECTVTSCDINVLKICFIFHFCASDEAQTDSKIDAAVTTKVCEKKLSSSVVSKVTDNDEMDCADDIDGETCRVQVKITGMSCSSCVNKIESSLSSKDGKRDSCVCVHMHVCVCLYSHVCVCVCLFVSTSACMHMCVYLCVRLHACACVYVCVCVWHIYIIRSGCFAGVQMIRVGLLAEKAEIKYNPSITAPEDLVSSIKSLGFGATLVDTISTIEGKIELMVCFFKVVE